MSLSPDARKATMPPDHISVQNERRLYRNFREIAEKKSGSSLGVCFQPNFDLRQIRFTPALLKSI
jgi:hypothetical protein